MNVSFMVVLCSKIQNKQERQTSRTIQLRKFNNWIKSCLIEKYSSECGGSIDSNTGPLAAVLDLCGGKFGDLQKYRFASQMNKVGYVVLAGVSESRCTISTRHSHISQCRCIAGRCVTVLISLTDSKVKRCRSAKLIEINSGMSQTVVTVVTVRQ
jgi:hypothetical protein